MPDNSVISGASDAWDYQPLGNLAEVSISNVDKKTLPREPSVRLCNYLDVYKNEFVDDTNPYMLATASPAEIEKFRLRPGDVIITKDSETPDDIGIATLVKNVAQDVVCGYHLALIRPREEVHGGFLAKQVGTSRIRRYFAKEANGSTRYGLSVTSVASTPIWLPPLPEQRRIAEILDTVDEAIRKTEQVIAKLQKMKQGLLHDLLTRGIDENGELRDPQRHPEQFKDSVLGRIPRGWGIKPLSETASIIDPNPSHRYPDEVAAGVPIVSTENFSGEDDYDLSYAKRVPWFVLRQQQSRCSYTRRDVVFARKGRIGLARRYGIEDKVFSHTIVIMKPRGDAASAFLLWLVRSEIFFHGIRQRMNSNSGVPTLGVEFLGRVPVPVPPPLEQERIAGTIDAWKEKLAEEQAILDKLRSVKHGLMEDLLTGRIRVTVPEESAA